jgi:hypothetical protein
MKTAMFRDPRNMAVGYNELVVLRSSYLADEAGALDAGTTKRHKASI